MASVRYTKTAKGATAGAGDNDANKDMTEFALSFVLHTQKPAELVRQNYAEGLPKKDLAEMLESSCTSGAFDILVSQKVHPFIFGLTLLALGKTIDWAWIVEQCLGNVETN
jgi:hypothetical protein